MTAMLVIIGTKYNCNLFQNGPNMIAMIENLYSRDTSRNHSHETNGRISTLQSYYVLFKNDCNHILWSPFLLRLQSY